MLSSVWSWVRGHKVLAVLAIPVLFILWELATIPYFDIHGLKTSNPGETALMRQRAEEAEEAGKKFNLVHRWIRISNIPRHTLDAIIAAEDGTFYSHSGIDWFEVQESISKNLEEGRAARGASTITQQLAKNLYLSTSKNFLRKMREVVITLLMENQLTKTRILELYVNLIEWGPGVFGIDAAARTYFGKSASELSLDESVRLAAVIPSPLRYRPNGDSRYVTRRAAIVLNRMSQRGDMKTGEDADEPVEGLEPYEMIEPLEIESLDSAVSVDSTDSQVDSIDSTGLADSLTTSD